MYGTTNIKVRIQLPSDRVAFPGITESLKMEDPIVRKRRGTSLKNLALTYTTTEASDSCCMLLFCIALLMQGCFHKSSGTFFFSTHTLQKYGRWIHVSSTEHISQTPQDRRLYVCSTCSDIGDSNTAALSPVESVHTEVMRSCLHMLSNTIHLLVCSTIYVWKQSSLLKIQIILKSVYPSIHPSIHPSGLFNSCRRLPETKRHSSRLLHWSGSKFLVVMAACTPSIHVYLGRPLFLLSHYEGKKLSMPT